MSRSIDFRLYDGLRQARPTILAIIRHLSLMQTVSKDWGGVAMSRRGKGFVSLLSEPRDRLSVNEVERLVSQQSADGPESWYITGASSLSIPGKESNNRIIDEQYVAIDVHAFDTLPGQQAPLFLNHFATVSLRPHYLLQSQDEVIQEARTDLLIYLVSMMASAVSPSAIHAFMPDIGYPWPLNSLMSYYESDAECAQDIGRMLTYWREMANSPMVEISVVDEHLSGHRSQEEENILLRDLNGVKLDSYSITANHVRTVRNSGRFDIIDRPESQGSGFIVLEYPNIFSTRMERFVFQVLHEAIR